MGLTSISGPKQGQNFNLPRFYSKNWQKTHTHTLLVWGFFTFQCFVFFLIFAFSCLSFSSFPCLFLLETPILSCFWQNVRKLSVPFWAPWHVFNRISVFCCLRLYIRRCMRSKRNPRAPQHHFLFVSFGGWVRGQGRGFQEAPPPPFFWWGLGRWEVVGGLWSVGWRVRVVDFRNPPPHSPLFLVG